MIALFAVMTVVSFGVRILPFLISKKMQQWPIWNKLGATLPTCIIILLVAHCVESTAFGWAEGLGLCGVLFMQISFRNILASMAVGVLIQQIILHLV